MANEKALNTGSNMQGQSVDNMTPEGSTGSPAGSPIDSSTPPEGNTPAEQGKQDVEFIKDDQGNEVVPRAAFEARLAKMAEQKHNAIGQFLETIQSNPEAKQQVLEALGMESANTSATPPGPSEPTAYEEWLKTSVQPELHTHFKAQADALYQTMIPNIEGMIREAISPLLSAVGKQHVERFQSAHPDFAQHKGKIQEMINSGRAKTLEDAYKLVTWEEKIKGAGAAALEQEKQRQSKLAGNPMRRNQSSPSGQQKPGSFRDALEQSARELGQI